jgi:hypothetical protein
MPALKNASLVVLDNASYHNVKTEDTVCLYFSQKKTVLQNYLTQHNIHNQTLASRTCMQNNQTFAFIRGYFWGINQTHHSEATYDLCSDFG